MNILTLIAAAILSVSAFAENSNTEQPMANCTSDTALTNKGFVNTQSFDTLFNEASSILENQKHSISIEMEQKFFHSLNKQWAVLTSYENSITPLDEMYGDIVVISSMDTGEVLEVRLYKNGQRLYAVKGSKCATNIIPMPENSLY